MSVIPTVTIASLVCVVLGVAMNVTLLMYAATGLGCVSLGFPIIRQAHLMWARRSGEPASARPIILALALAD